MSTMQRTKAQNKNRKTKNPKKVSHPNPKLKIGHPLKLNKSNKPQNQLNPL